MNELTIGINFNTKKADFSELQEKANQLKKTLSNLKGFDNLRNSVEKTKSSLVDLREKHRKLQNNLKKEEKGSASYKKLQKELRRTITSLNATEKKFLSQRTKLAKLRKELNLSSVSTKEFGKQQDNAKNSLEKLNKAIEKEQRLTERRDNRLQRGQNAAVLAMYSNNVVSRIAGYGKGILNLGNSFLQTSRQFEKYQTILETIEGDTGKAKKSMDWVSEFAAKTPYELAEVTDAFVKLKAYGLEPTGGLLETLGDTGSAMGKPIMQAVEAIADAVTGENERLKEFGIKASSKGETITYNYTDSKGIQKSLQANKNNRKEIEKVLTSIWSEKYGGGMQKQAKTFSGMMSNMADTYAQFQMAIMNSGGFDALKETLADLLQKTGDFLSSNEGKKFVRDLGLAVKDLVIAFVELTKWLAPVFIAMAKFATQNTGLIKGFIVITVAVGGFIAILSKVLSIWALLNAAFSISPLGAIILGITAVIGLFVYLEKKFAIFSKMWNKLAGGFKKVASWFGFGGEDEEENSAGKKNIANTAQQNAQLVDNFGKFDSNANINAGGLSIAPSPFGSDSLNAKGNFNQVISSQSTNNAPITVNITANNTNATAEDIAAKVRAELEKWQTERENRQARSFA